MPTPPSLNDDVRDVNAADMAGYWGRLHCIFPVRDERIYQGGAMVALYALVLPMYSGAKNADAPNT